VRREAYLKKSGDKTHTVLPGHLLALFAPTCVVVDRNFVDTIAQPEHSSGDIRITVETATLHVEPPPEVGSKHLVAGIDVGDIAVKKDVAGGRDPPASDHEQEAVSSLTSEAANSVNHIGLPF